MATSVYSIVMVIIATVIGAFGPIYLKRGSSEFDFNLFKLLRNWNIIKGVLFYAIATTIFIPALKNGELSVLYPFVALSYVWVAILSIKMLNEKMDTMKWIGIVLIVFGVFLIGVGS